MALRTLLHVGCGPLTLALAKLRRVLRPQGRAVIICHYLHAAAKLIAEDRLFDLIHEEGAGSATPFDMLFSLRAMAGREKPYMAHHCGFTASTPQEALPGSGFACRRWSGRNCRPWQAGT
ncbi:MAG: hypothetical protein K9K38_23085 [Rhodoferax sp.]|nr:hypothetical protein [Rhodoferax sp.]MCF8212256.1 hypothetical protein [Rhodoferax sp.]